MGNADAACLGMLSLRECSWWLEDLDDRIKLDLSQCAVNHILGDGMMACVTGLVHGDHGKEILAVQSIQPPPPEPRQQALQLTHPRLFKTPSLHSDQLSQQAILVVSEVHLDQTGCLEQLIRLISSFELDGETPLMTILLGPFVNGDISYELVFERLAEALVRHCPLFVQRGMLMLIPSIEEPFYHGNLMPRAPLPDDLALPFTQRNIMIQMAANPCRIGFCGHELVILRHNLARSLKPISHQMDIPIPHCLIEQAHLLPLPMDQQPITWSLDHTLGMNPLPDALIVAERGSRYSGSYAGVAYANPGGWAQSRFSFALYHPLRNTVNLGRLE